MNNRYWLLLLLVSAVLTGCAEESTTTDQETLAPEQEAVSERQVLFDGADLDQWKGYNQDTISSKWQIEEGTLTLTEGGAGDIMTREEFGNFELELEWKISEGGNSGIFFHVVESDTLGATYLSAPEMQILDDAMHPDGELITHRAGANYDMQPCSSVATAPVGEWNKVRLIYNEGAVEHWLNGVMVVAYQEGSDEWKEQLAKSKFHDWPMYAKSSTGHIALQDHGDKVWFRNIRIKSL